MGLLPASLQDTVSGLGAAASDAARNVAIAKTEDNATLHPLLLSLLGGAPQAKGPVPIVGPLSPGASLPHSDTAAPPWYKRTWVIVVAVIAVVVILGGGAKLLKR